LCNILAETTSYYDDLREVKKEYPSLARSEIISLKVK